MVLEADWREAYWQLLGEGMPVFLAVRPPRPAGTPPEESYRSEPIPLSHEGMLARPKRLAWSWQDYQDGCAPRDDRIPMIC